MNGKLYSLRKSFAYAINGIVFCVRYERNMRIHLTIFAYVMFFSLFFYNFTRAELILLVLTCAFVMALEIVNTAIEVLTDRASPKPHPLAKVAKDTAAGAVLVSAVTAVIVGVILFWDLEILREIGMFFISNIAALIALLASVGLSVVFIFFTGKERKKNL
ncbi:MAG: diacylglycerol kinase family protein [Oscillospiraceae bacterium]|nr:diacylglycerol kinase family protein [Oscillospiraceae bacterium]